MDLNVKNLLRIITALVCFSPVQTFSVEIPEQKPLCKQSAAIPASAATQAFFGQVFIDYGLDPNNYQILTYNDPSKNVGAAASDLKKTIWVNETTFENDDFDVDKPDNWYKIYAAYHEAGHIKDRALLKGLAIKLPISLAISHILLKASKYLETYLAQKYSQSSLFYNFPLNIGGYKLDSISPFSSFCTIFTAIASYYLTSYVSDKINKNSPEIRADTLAFEQLLQKEWGIDTIAVALHTTMHDILSNRKCEGHDAESEYNNMVQLMEKNGYEVECTIGEKSLAIAIGKNGQLIAGYASGL